MHTYSRWNGRPALQSNVQVCLDNSDWSGVAKVSELERIPSYCDASQLTGRILLPESCPSYSGFRVIKVRVIETHLYLQLRVCILLDAIPTCDAC